MKRYLIFAALGPALGGFLLLLTSTLTSGYWDEPALRELTKIVSALLTTLQYTYLFGLLPALMIAAVDDILYHVRQIRPFARMLILGVIAFVAAEFLYGSRGPDRGTAQFVLYGLVGLVPAMLSSWLAHWTDERRVAKA